MTRESEPNGRIVLLVLEGYAYLLLIIAVFVGSVSFLLWGLLSRRPLIALVAVGVGIPMLAAAATAIRSLFFSVPRPEGIRVTAMQAPALHDVVNRLRKQIGAPAVHEILIDGAFNAAVMQRSRLRVFRPRNTLLIGYPLLAMLSPDQLRAVVVHELAHLSSRHGRFSSWVYRTQASWMRLMDSLHTRGATPTFAYWLFRWYVPRLQACSAANARRQELLADRCAAAIAGNAAAVEALIVLGMGGELFDRVFWPGVFDKVKSHPEPPRPFATLGSDIWSAIATSPISELLDNEVSSDTHPTFRQRLEALGAPAKAPSQPDPCAGEVYLGAWMKDVAAMLDTAWQTKHSAAWRAKHSAIRENRERLRQLAELQEPTPADMFECGRLSETFEDSDGALKYYRAAAEGGHAAAALAVGRILLDREDEDGVAFIDRAMEGNEALVAEGCARASRFYQNRGRITDAHRYALRSTRQTTRDRMAHSERDQVTPFDRFVPHGLNESTISAIVARLEGQSDVINAWMAMKELRYGNGKALILAITAKGSSSASLAATIGAKELLPKDAAIILLTRRDAMLQSALESVPGALIYSRSR